MNYSGQSKTDGWWCCRVGSGTEYIELLMIAHSLGIVEQKGCVKGANIEICLLNKLHSVCIYLLMTGSYGEVTTAPVKKPKRHWRVTMAKSDNDYYNYLLSCGFDEQEAQQKMKEREIMIDLYQGKKEQREITSHAYELSKKRLTKEIQDFLWGGRY